ncbi:MAG: hypothetical protein SF182_18040 [Deltaproteobacteria bacterium]|nr:hypothetical protein [Deltaproteobacteria bacterium]
MMRARLPHAPSELAAVLPHGRQPTSWLTRAQRAPRLLRRAARHSWRTHRPLFLVVYGGALAVCGAAALLPLLAGRSPLYAYVEWMTASGPGEGAMTAASGALLLLAGVAFARAGWRSGERAWLAAGAGCVWLALDELLMLHERANSHLAAAGVPRPFGVVDQDLYVFAAYGVGAALLAWRLLPRLLARRALCAPLCIALVCFALSEAADAVPWASLDRPARGLLGPFEEIAKTLGVVSLLLYAGLLAHRVERERRGGAA